MSAGPAKAPILQGKPQRRVPRHAASVPVDITILRSGVPDCIPGRTLNLGEGGMGAILAAEVRLGDTVGVEFRLPDLPVRLQAKAIVRHQQRLRCGLEFRSLSPEQLAMLRYWCHAQRGLSSLTKPTTRSEHAVPASLEAARKEARQHSRSYARLWAVLVLLSTIGAVGWWQWHRAWQELEAQLPGWHAAQSPQRLQIPPEEMEQLVIDRVDPIYPEEARTAGITGVVVVEAVIGADGSVRQVRPVSGPPLLAPAAADAVKWWRFQPYQVNGKATEIETTVSLDLRPQ